MHLRVLSVNHKFTAYADKDQAPTNPKTLHSNSRELETRRDKQQKTLLKNYTRTKKETFFSVDRTHDASIFT